jgi:hypothetical protein
VIGRLLGVITDATSRPAERRREALRERFVESIPTVVSRFHAFAETLASRPAHPGLVAALWRECHRVHGVARSHGFMEASRLAGALERRVRGWAGDAALERGERARVIGDFAEAIDAAFATDHPAIG